LTLVWVSCCLPHERDTDKASTTRPVAEDEEQKPAEKKPARATAAERKLAAMETKARNDPALSEPFTDDFERSAIGADWRVTGPGWRISDGRLCGERARNHPVWLARKLPVNTLVEFDALSHSSDGDIKAEIFGDGARFAAGASYEDATSYLTIFGGWSNRLHVLARLDEHAADREATHLTAEGESLRTKKVEPQTSYRFRIERRDGRTLSWSVDGEKIHDFTDPEPLVGEEHDHFAFNDWEARVCFDNLSVTPL
jgi:hypothetical protein